MYIIGVDPGTTRIGYGIVKKTSNKTEYVTSGLIKINSKIPDIKKLSVLRLELSLLMQQYAPPIAAVEKIFFFKNMKTAMAVAQARGVILETIGRFGAALYEYTPLQVKQSVSAYGRASKTQVQEVVRLILGLESKPKPDDVADALAIAICCAHSIR